MSFRGFRFVGAAVACAALLHTAEAAAAPDDLELPTDEEELVPTEPPPPPGPSPEVVALEGQVSSLTERLAALEAAAAEERAAEAAEAEAAAAALAAEVAAAEAAKPDDRPAWVEAVDLRVSGYVQGQLVLSQLSQDEVNPDGGAMNQDRFAIRRARLRVDRHWKFAHVDLEIDANTVRGPFVSVRRAEGTLLLPHPDEGRMPYVAFTGGLEEIPFGYEMLQGHRERVFTERTVGSLAFFRGEPDVGGELWGGLGPFRYAVALQNGVPLDDRPNAVTTVFNQQKTLVGRVGLDGSAPEERELAVGASFLQGTGFHAGAPETKSSLNWRDLNQDGFVSLNELVASPGQASTSSETFERWGVGADLELGVKTGLGWTRLYGEAILASNLDRGYYVADPVATGYDLRETSWYVAAVQELGIGLAAFRAEQYEPNSDLFEARRGVFVPVDASITTLSPVLGAQIRGLGRFTVQYDYVVDHLGRDLSGVPIDLKNDQWTLRQQMEF